MNSVRTTEIKNKYVEARNQSYLTNTDAQSPLSQGHPPATRLQTATPALGLRNTQPSLPAAIPEAPEKKKRWELA
jgi:hypothetical protein